MIVKLPVPPNVVFGCPNEKALKDGLCYNYNTIGPGSAQIIKQSCNPGYRLSGGMCFHNDNFTNTDDDDNFTNTSINNDNFTNIMIFIIIIIIMYLVLYKKQ